MSNRQAGGVKPNARPPTLKEFADGAKVTLTRPGWNNGAWKVHGIDYNIEFNQFAKAVVLKSHYDLWIGPENANVNGVTVTELPKPKSKSTKKESK
jgi:hypothetical protein